MLPRSRPTLWSAITAPLVLVLLVIASGQPPAADTGWYAEPAHPSAAAPLAASADRPAQESASRRAKNRATLKAEGFRDSGDYVYLSLKGRAPTKGSRRVVLQGRPTEDDGASSTWTKISAHGTWKNGRFTVTSQWTMDAEYRVVLPKWNGKRRATSRPIEVPFRPGGPLVGDIEVVPGVATADEATMSDDGSVVAYTVATEGSSGYADRIFRYDAVSGAVAELHPPVAGDPHDLGFENLHLSGDGRWLAFTVMVPADEPGWYRRAGVHLHDATDGTFRVVEGAGADLHALDTADMSADAGTFVGSLWLSDEQARAMVVVDVPTGEVEVIARRPDGSPAFGYGLQLTDDGRQVFFGSDEPGLVAGDDTDSEDAFRYDRSTGEIVRVSLGDDGSPLEEGGWPLAVSGDGRFLVLDDYTDVWTPRVFDAETGLSAAVRVAWNGRPDAVDSLHGLSRDGSRAISGACGGDTSQAFIADLETGEATRLTTDARGRPANGTSGPAQISGDGRTVLIRGNATNLADGPSPTGLFLWRERVDD